MVFNYNLLLAGESGKPASLPGMGRELRYPPSWDAACTGSGSRQQGVRGRGYDNRY